MCKHSQSVSISPFPVILMKHIFIVGNIFYHVQLLEHEQVFITPPGQCVARISLPCLL